LGLFWIAMALLGFPFPFLDDLFYTGTALNLAQGGGLENPLLEHFGPFYFYPPGYAFFLAGWLKLFGISSAAIIVFHILLCWSVTWLVLEIFILVRDEFLGWMVLATLLVYFSSVGLRADVAGFFFLCLSIRMGIAERLAWRRLSPFWALSALLILPALVAIVVPWIIYLLSKEKALWLPAGIGGLVTLLLLGLMLNWHFGDFINGFAQGVPGARAIALSAFLDGWYQPKLVIKVLLPMLICLTFIMLAVIQRGFRCPDFLMILSLALGLYANISSLSGTKILPLIALIGIGLYRREAGVRLGRLILATCTAAIFFFSMRPLI
jgi:hypothetical protein